MPPDWTLILLIVVLFVIGVYIGTPKSKCAWCGHVKGLRPRFRGDTHGICRKCYEDVEKEWR